MIIRIVFVILAALACNQVNAEVIGTGAVGCPSKILLNRQNRLISKGDYRLVSGCWSHDKQTDARVVRGGLKRSLVRRNGSSASYFVNTRMLEESEK